MNFLGTFVLKESQNITKFPKMSIRTLAYQKQIKNLLDQYLLAHPDSSSFYEQLLSDSSYFWRIYELLVCYLGDCWDWHDVPIIDRIKLSVDRMDRGVDAISLDLKTAIQIKWKPRSKITFTELSTFFTYARDILKCDKFRIVTNEHVEFCKLWTQLRESTGCLHECIPEPSIKDYLYGIWNYSEPPPLLVKFKLRDYQQKALDAIKRGKDEVLIEMACGSGKSHVINELCQEGRNVVFVPSLLLMEQFNRWFGFERVGTSYVPNPEAKNSFVFTTVRLNCEN